MYLDNKTTFIKREIMTNIAKLYFEDKLIDEIEKLPINLIKKDAEPFRCCIYKDREIIKYRTIAILGFSLDNEEEIDTNLLADYAKKAISRTNIEFPILTFIDEACRSCVRTNYFVTNVCKNCVAKPCIVNCPKDAIIINNNQANIVAEKCVNCGLCMKVCPFHAIVFVPVPCEEDCPVGAISKDSNGKQNIDYSKCIFCGKCSKACPFGAIMEKSQIIDVIKHIKNKKDVVAMIAPSIIGQFSGNIYQIVTSLKELGFTKVIEVALGADITAEIESKEFIERMEKGDKLMGTSCCPAYIEAVKKHSQEFNPYVSHAKTPMAYTAEIVKKEFPDSITVFIGPCVAKKHEGLNNKNIDYVLTFEELFSLFISKGIEVEKQKESKFDFSEATNIGRNFPVSSGVANAIKNELKNLNLIDKVNLNPVFINGFTKQNVKLLSIYAKGKCPGNLVEVMSCEGGCIAGPGVINKPQLAIKKLNDFIDNKK